MGGSVNPLGLGNDPTMQMLQQQQLLQNSMNDPMSNLLAQQMAQLQMQQQLTFQQPLAYPSSASNIAGMGYPNLPLGGLGATSNDPLVRSIDDNLFNQLRAKQLQSQLMQANQQAALMGASASGLYNQMGSLGFSADLNSLGS